MQDSNALVENKEPVDEKNMITTEVKSLLGRKFIKTYSSRYLCYLEGSEIYNSERLSNFIIDFDKQVKTVVDGIQQTLLYGTLKLQGGKEFEIKQFPSTLFVYPQKFKEYIYNLCGISAKVFNKTTDLLAAIQLFNDHILTIESVEFGYNEELTQFLTPTHIIKDNTFLKNSASIIGSDSWDCNKLELIIKNKFDFASFRNQFIEYYFGRDDLIVTMNTFAYTLLPLIHPFLKNIVEGKPFLMLKGVTGCGKTTLSKYSACFYGEFKKLFSWTSTTTAINVAGNAYKDALFVVDDFKKQNFYNDSDIRRAMSLLQNYYDGQTRSRSNTSLTLRDDRPIKGFLLISAEDLVITEASTIARGIIIDVPAKMPNYENESKLKNLTILFKQFTPKYIQFLLSNKEINLVPLVFKENVTLIYNYVKENNLVGDNIPRLVNNFALLKTSWDIASLFLFELTKSDQYDELNMIYSERFFQLFQENFKRIQHHKPEAKFEETLWHLVESKFYNILDYANKDNQFVSREKLLGYYQKEKDGSVKLIIKFENAYKAINNYLFQEGGLGISRDTLKSKLIFDKKIRTTNSGSVSLGSGNTERGVYWIGDVPYEEIGIPAPNLKEDIKDPFLIETNDDDLPF